ncbi:MAG: outer membrane protein transport protein [Myxococcales bacterium]|nr:outer membrane protein transport protein [Myxococcales bacterium]
MARPHRPRLRAPLRTLSLALGVSCGASFGVSFGVLATAGTAHASGIAVARFGGEHGHPTTDNPTAIYYNPAGIALRPGTRIFLDGSLAGRWASYTRPESAISKAGTGTPDDAISANAGTAKLANTLFSPFFGVSSDFGTKIFSAGAAVYFPFGGQAVWKDNTQYGDSKYPGASDGVQRWHTIDGKIRSMYISGAVAFNIPQIGLSIGVNGSAIRSEVDTLRARNTDGTDDLVYGSGATKEGRSWLNAKGWQGSFAVGAIWNWRSKLWLGGSYTSQPNVVGGMTLKGTLHNLFPPNYDPSGQVTNVEFTQTLPDIIRLGIRGRPTERLELRLFADYTRWSVFDKQCVLNATVDSRNCNIPNEAAALDKPEEYGVDDPGDSSLVQLLPRFWKDAGGVRAGASYWFIPNLETYVGVGFDSSAVRRQTLDAALLDTNKMSFSLGARWQIVRQFAIALTVTDIAYFKTDTKGQNVLGKFKSTAGQPSADGVYKQNILLGQLYLDAHF